MTTDERLAELEAKMAALTTPPDDYYTSRYSGEEIDSGIDRAKSGGAIDKAIQAKANPNLLDNWYFGNPVDQRGGYVVPPDTPYYSDTGLSTQVSTVSAYTTAVYVDGTYGTITVDSTTYYVAWSAVVRGYTGAGYGIDRWLSHEASNTTLIYDDHITISRQHAQIIDNYANLVGKQVTISALTNLGLFVATSVCTNNDGAQAIYDDGNGHYIILYNSGTYHGFQINNTKGGTLDLYGVKIELGTQQTIAHQDADGNWALNEIPDFGEQLRRCQRYFQRFTMEGQRFIGAAILDSPSGGQGVINTAVQMRTSPAISGNLCIYNAINNLPCTDFAAKGIGSNGIFVTFSAANMPQTPASALLYAGGIVDLSADL